MAESYQFIFIFLLILTTTVEYYLGQRQKKFVLKNKEKVPAAFTKVIKLTDHKKAADYTVTKINFNSIELVFGAIILYFLTLGGGINLMNNAMGQYFENPLLNGAVVITSIFIALHLINIPSAIYQTFVIEAKYDFNKITPKLFLIDQIKSIFVVMIPLTAIISFSALWILSELGTNWWVWLWIFLSIFSIAGVALAPVLKQLFNKYTPLKDKNLKKNIEKLLKRCGFESSGLFEMNGSLRSTHGNAFFGGFGKTKRIIFFDTLLEKLNTKEIEAVIAHELGHFKRNHVKKLLFIQITLIFFSLYFFSGLKDTQAFYNGLGIEALSDVNFLMLFTLVLLPFVMFFVGPFISGLQRKYEFEADEYACEFAKPTDLKQSLIKLYRDNASTLTPDPVYSAFYHSHPPASIRIQAIDKS
ncbi:MAG: M48 family metallopeptidase [Nitrosomonadales bacterium]|jgi:STE24 endopeptidase|nr:M48 family metallopeptidase [Nitrosomonadales bacterium]MBT4183609.1 M48 family metallopeptidase [Nitrosomonadales bacterium]MBT4571307.1 M48 family metallopeptidase [Nitrosomonadales bacterium]MBT6014798.1 M48 family metallopeptidase [Nitrosomonadales bacterium]MBT6602725.1 M48 family metallopeptidase [Nitrosomonadales bacterium]